MTLWSSYIICPVPGYQQQSGQNSHLSASIAKAHSPSKEERKQGGKERAGEERKNRREEKARAGKRGRMTMYCCFCQLSFFYFMHLLFVYNR
jgi:hypothetical protein